MKCDKNCTGCPTFDECWAEIEEFLDQLDESGVMPGVFAKRVIGVIEDWRER